MQLLKSLGHIPIIVAKSLPEGSSSRMCIFSLLRFGSIGRRCVIAVLMMDGDRDLGSVEVVLMRLTAFRTNPRSKRKLRPNEASQSR